MEKRYQIFISSTYKDLIEERDVTLKALLEMNHFPAGMELFPAADDSQIKYIQQVIDDSDYYLLILGGKYGSIGKDGIGYTEMEFDYAVYKKKPIIAFVHSDISKIPMEKSEIEPLKRELYENFHKKVLSERIVKFWKNKDELGRLVSVSVSHLIKSHPAVGWQRTDQIGPFIPGSFNPELYVPSHVFEPTETSSVKFNQDLTLELRRSRNYIFRGVSGKRCAVRIKNLRHNPNEISLKFIMPHPYWRDELLDERISHRMRARNKFNFEDEKKRMRYDVHLSIVALWNIRYMYKSCEIVFQQESSISRLEIFDHAAYISLYDSNLVDRKYNPSIIKFQDTSLFYEVYYMEVQREIDFARKEDNMIFMNKKSTKVELIQNFERLDLDKLDELAMNNYIADFEVFESQFLEQSHINNI